MVNIAWKFRLVNWFEYALIIQLVNNMLHVIPSLNDKLVYRDLAQIDQDVWVLSHIPILFQEWVNFLLLHFISIFLNLIVALNLDQALNYGLWLLLGAHQLLVDSIVVINDVHVWSELHYLGHIIGIVPVIHHPEVDVLQLDRHDHFPMGPFSLVYVQILVIFFLLQPLSLFIFTFV